MEVEDVDLEEVEVVYLKVVDIEVVDVEFVDVEVEDVELVVDILVDTSAFNDEVIVPFSVFIPSGLPVAGR